MKTGHLIIAAVILFALTISVLGVGIVENKNSYYPPAPGVPLLGTDADQTANVDLANDPKGYGALVMPSGSRDPSHDTVLLLASDLKTAQKQANDWAAAHHPGATVMMLPPRSVNLVPPMPPTPPAR